ncbi:MAG: 3-keto-5-aminohexanoate cleavage protein [Sulfuricaulis sp.]|nr:3-keto-5-aminohexanoate cleavage protein [Sulfuricaulis sp.]
MASKYDVVNMTKEAANHMFPVDKEERILTLDKPLFIESACPGWQIGGERYPAIPTTIKEQIKEISESVKAGAGVVHIHPRDPQTSMMQINPSLLKEIMDGVFDEVGDCVTWNHSWYPVPNGAIDYITETNELLEMGEGNKYIQGSVVLPVGRFSGTAASLFTHKTTKEGLKWMEAHSVKPIYQLYDSYAHFHFKRFMDDGTSTWKPYVFNLHMGKHDSHAIHQDPWSFMNAIANVGMVKATIPDSIIGMYPGGRNWLPIMIMGMMLGVDVVRVGVEDCYWMWPHKDDIIKKNSDTVKIAMEVANILGRRVVTDPNEIRSICGMKLTSKLHGGTRLQPAKSPSLSGA